MKKYRLSKPVMISMSVLFVLAMSSAVVSAATANTTITAQIQPVISVSSTGSVNLSITPGTSGSVSSGSDTVTVSTNDAIGYTLTFSDSDATASLVNGGNSITASSGTQAAPVALANNTWGYRVDGVGGFTGTTTTETNVANSAFNWAGVPVLASPNTIKSTSGPSGSDVTKFWYAAKVNQTLPSGSYSDTVVYTATTK